jgi:hypothetical protein
MSNPTTPFSWQMPTNTDLVTDLPADFEVFGQAVATSLADLLGGTTGQVLSKNSNTDMDFTWVTDPGGDITGVTAGTGISGGGTSGTVTVTNSMATAITTAGDLIKGTGSGTFDRLGIGSAGQVSTVSAGIPAWVTPAGGGGKVLQVIQGTLATTANTTSTTYVDTGLSASITPAAATSKILVMVTHNYEVFPNSALGSASAAFTILRGATDILGNPVYNISIGGSSSANLDLATPWVYAYLDSPSTTSATTYKTQMKVESGRTIYANLSTRNQTSTIILMEIGA